jgi:hypothetical protein
MRYLGIDWSRKTSTFDLSDANGKRLQRGEIANDPDAFKEFVEKWKDEEGLFVVIEWVLAYSDGYVRCSKSMASEFSSWKHMGMR